MGQHMRGATIIYGQPIFLTISPSERHSTLILRLSRFRTCDTLFQSMSSDEVKAQFQYAGSNRPSLFSEGDNPEEVEIDLPPYNLRRAMMVKDNLSIVEAFDVQGRFILGRLLGLRVCPKCPRCNAQRSKAACQNYYGSNMLPMGGIMGVPDAFDASIENQHGGNLHAHVRVFIQRVHQHHTLQEVGERIQQGLLDPETLKTYNTWICREEHFDQAQHAASIDEVEKQWPAFEERIHDAMGAMPSFVAKDNSPALGSSNVTVVELREEGLQWQKKAFRFAQYIFTRTQHHHHTKRADGTRVPLTACLNKGKRK